MPPSKPIEWLSAYENVSKRQQMYLSKLQDMRRELQNRDEQMMMVAIERHRLLRGRRKDPKLPTMSRMQGKVMTFGPSPFPQRHCNMQEKGKFHLAPSPSPPKLPPIIKGKQIVGPKADAVADKDHESIEAIAKRNKLNFTYYNMDLNSPSLSRRSLGSPVRAQIRLNKVSLHGLQSPGAEVEEPMTKQMAPVEYITDFSSRKKVYSGQAKAH